MRRHLLLIPALLFVASSLLPGQTAVADAPASREDVVKLFDVMHIHDQMRQVMESMLTQQRSMVHEAMKKRAPQTSEEELARMDSFMQNVVKEMPVDDMLNDVIPVYQKHLSKGDVEAMSVFYASSTGQKLLREMSAMTTESMQAAYPRMQAMLDEVMDRAEQRAREEQEKKKAAPEADTQKN